MVVEQLPLPGIETSTIFGKLPYEVQIIPTHALPTVMVMRKKFFENYKLPWEEPSAKLRWFGVFNTVTCLVVFALGQREDGGVEATDFYALPTREGAKCAEWTIQVATELIDHGVAPYLYTWVLGRNHAQQRRLKKIFGVKEPRSVMFVYGNK